MANSLNKITTKSILDATVATADIAADAVTGAKIADDAIDSEHYTDGSIDTAHIANDAVTLAKLAQGTDGQIITYDASGNPVAVGPGNDGQVLTSTGAGSPPAFEDVPAGGATINNATENELVTVASTTSQLDAEASLTFDGNHLTQTIDADAEGFNQTASGNHYIKNVVDANRSSANSGILAYTGKWNGKEVAAIKFRTGGDTTNKDDGHITFETSSQNNISEVMRIDTAGRVGIGTDNPGSFKLKLEGGDSDEGLFVHAGASSSQWLIRAEDNAATQRFVVKADGEVVIGNGDLIFGTAGKGICLGATSNTDANTLEDYEEGTWTPTFVSNGGTNPTCTYGTRFGTYTKIGNVVYYSFFFSDVDIDSHGSGNAAIGGFPFTAKSESTFGYLNAVGHVTSSKFSADTVTGLFVRQGEAIASLMLNTGSQITFQTNHDDYSIGGSGFYFT